MIDLDKTINELTAKLQQGEESNLQLSEAQKTIKNIKLECASLNDENTNLKQDMHNLLKKLYTNYDQREQLLANDSNS